jgi:hypothetical protein
MTRVLLAGGIIAGPLYLLVGLIEILTRPGFDVTRHELSLMSLGDLGWIQITSFIVTALLVIGGAIGMRSVLRSGRGRIWGPLLIGLFGLGLIAAGIFVPDPINGFPPGMPQSTAPSWHALLHLVSGAIGFTGLIVACFIFARRFGDLGERGWSIYSLVTGILFLAAFIGIASGAQLPVLVIGFYLGVIIGFAWISALSARMLRDAGSLALSA